MNSSPKTPCVSSTAYHNGAYLQSAATLVPGGALEVFRCGKACVPMIVRPLPRECGDGFDAISPYDFAGPLLHGEDPGAVWRSLRAWAADRKIVTVFFRLNPLLEDAGRWGGLQGLSMVRAADNVIVELDDPSQFSSNCKATVHRDAKVARRAGVQCQMEPISRAELDAFVPLYRATMKRNDATPFYHFPRAFFDTLANTCGDAFAVATARLDGESIASALVLLDGEDSYYYLACSSDAGRRVCAMNLLVYETAERLAQRNVRRFHLGGGGDTLHAFKARFSPARVPYFIGRGIFDTERYETFCEGRSTEFFPAYRAPSTETDLAEPKTLQECHG